MGADQDNICYFYGLYENQYKIFPTKKKEQNIIKQRYIEAIDQATNHKGHDGVFYDHDCLPVNHHPIEKISHHIWIRSHNPQKVISYNQLDNIIQLIVKTGIALERVKQMVQPLYQRLEVQLDTIIKENIIENVYEKEIFKRYAESSVKVEVQDDLINLTNELVRENISAEVAKNIVFQSFNEISSKDLANLIKQINKMDSSNSEFKHILWCNSIELIPSTIAALKAVNIEVRDINSLNAEIKNLDFIKNLIESDIYGLAIDILKYEVVRIFGGLVVDLNYNLINNNMDKMLDSYSFFTHARWTNEDQSFQFENNMFAAHKGHSILTETCMQIDMSLEFIKDLDYKANCTQSDLVHQLSYLQWGNAISNNFNININASDSIDEIFPGEYECQRFDEHGTLISNTMFCNIIGADGTEQSWNIDGS
jgi:hypothetical protein